MWDRRERMTGANRYIQRSGAHGSCWTATSVYGGWGFRWEMGMNGEATEQHLRYLIVGLLHVGRLRRGDPLPSIRAVARDFGADHRAVAAAYRVLEAEGLVEIRPGAGVYL